MFNKSNQIKINTGRYIGTDLCTTEVVIVERVEAKWRKNQCLATVAMEPKTQSDETLQHKFNLKKKKNSTIVKKYHESKFKMISNNS